MDAQQLHNILLHTFSTDNNARQAAEAEIKNLHNVRGSLVLLIQITVEESVGRDIRQAAAVSLKNLVHKYWEGDHINGEFIRVIPEEERVVSRQNVLEALFVTHDKSLRSLLAETVSYIARLDFPSNWPSLIETIVANLQSGEPQRIINALLALRRVVKNFEYRSEENMGPLHTLAPVIFPMLHTMFTQLSTNQTIESAMMMHLILKTYWSCVKTHLVPFLAQVDQVLAWNELFRMVLAKPLPEAHEGLEPLGQPLDEEERNQWPWWKAKQWVLQIMCRFYTRYGAPKRVEVEYQEMATIYKNQVAPGLLPFVLETLSLRKNGRYCPDRVVQLSLVFIQEAIDASVTYKLLKPHLSFLLLEVIHPILCLTPKDLTLWQEDPHEFVRKENDFMEDFVDPVFAAENLLAELCTKRGKDCLSPVLVFYTGILSHYLASSETSRDYIQKDAALHALFALDTVLTKSKAHKSQVESMIITHIIPEFKNPNGFLRLRACKLFSRKYMETIRFQQESTLIAIIQGMMDCMFDPELPVRIEAAKTLRFVVQYPYSETVLQVLQPRLPQILQQYFSLMDEIGSDEVVVALEQIIDKFGDEIGPFALQLIEKFVEFFTQFTMAGDEDDDACLAAVSCLEAMHTILVSIHHHPELYGLMVPTLAPLVHQVLTNEEYIEYMEGAIDIYATLAYCCRTIPATLWSLFPSLFTCFHGFGADYLPNFVHVIDNCVGRDMETFLKGVSIDPTTNQSTRYVDLVLRMAQTVIEDGQAQDMDLCAVSKLFYSLLHNLKGNIDDVIPDIIRMTVTRLASTDAEDSVIRSFLGVFASLLYYNPLQTTRVLEQLQATQGVFTLWMTKVSLLESKLDRKLFILGITSLFQLPMDQLPALLRPHLKQMMDAGMKMLAASIQGGAQGNGEEEEEEHGNAQLEQLLDAGGYGSDEDAEEVYDDDYLSILKQLREETSLDQMYYDDDEDDYTSQLDLVDEVEFFLTTLQGFAQGNPTEYQSFGLETQVETQQLLMMFTQEHDRRQKLKASE